MPSLKDELTIGITKTKQILYPLIEKSVDLNESASRANTLLKLAYESLECAQAEINARANDNIASIQRRF